jgi:hypothetical protein
MGCIVSQAGRHGKQGAAGLWPDSARARERIM